MVSIFFFKPLISIRKLGFDSFLEAQVSSFILVITRNYQRLEKSLEFIFILCIYCCLSCPASHFVTSQYYLCVLWRLGAGALQHNLFLFLFFYVILCVCESLLCWGFGGPGGTSWLGSTGGSGVRQSNCSRLIRWTFLKFSTSCCKND